MECADLLECVRKRIVSDVVKERRRSHDRLLVFADRDGVFRLAQEREGATRQMMCAERVLESRMGRAGVDEIGPAQLSNVTQALKDFGIDELEGELVDSDVVPDRVAQNLEAHGPFIPVCSR